MDEVVIQIPKKELKSWLEKIAEGMNPKVTFSDDQEKMKIEAMKRKDEMLYYINHRIYAFMPNEN